MREEVEINKKIYFEDPQINKGFGFSSTEQDEEKEELEENEFIEKNIVTKTPFNSPAIAKVVSD